MSLVFVNIFMYSYSDGEMHPILLALFTFHLIHENKLRFSKLKVASGSLINLLEICILEYFKCEGLN